ncbi:MAG: phosphatase PAP2-related protein [Candidatus Jorgensenbacteria bacterium]
MSLSEKYKSCLKDKKFLVSVAAGLLFLAASIVVAFFAIVYSTERASGPVTDFILSNIPVFDVDGIFLYGPFIFFALVAAYLAFEPRKIPFILKSIALFTVIRSVFISLTHIGPFPVHAQVATSGIWGVFTSGADLFFSSHTGLPFLLALAFWDVRYMRYFCLAVSIIFGAVVLLAHLHYSIDVFAAFFITYTIFTIAKKLFRRDAEFFAQDFHPAT